MIGARARMLDSRARVTGRLEFAADAEPAGVLHVAVRRSDEAHARLVDVDVSEAASADGVVTTLVADDLDELGIGRCFGPVFRDQPVIAGDRVRYVGEPIAAVAATNPRSAEAAAAAIEVDYDPLPAVFDPSEALARGAPLIHDDPGEQASGFADIILNGRTGNVCNKFQLRKGNMQEGFDSADEIFEHEFTSPGVQHVSMEPHAALARFDGDRLTVTTSTQTPYAVRDELAALFGVPTSRVRVIVPPVGGGFGGKTYCKIEPLAAAMALKTRRPVKVVLAREEEFYTNRKHAARIRLRTGVKRDGTIVARQVEAMFNAGAYTDISPRLIKNGGYGAVGPYRIPHITVDSYAVYTNLPSAGAFRGYGVSQGAWAYESQMDIIADALHIDRAEIRHRNFLQDHDTFATGETLHGLHFSKVLSDAISVFTSDDECETNGNVAVGHGFATVIKSTITPSTSNSTVTLDSDGCLHVLTSTVEMGQGSHTALAQIAANGLDLTTAVVNVAGPDTDSTPYDLTTSSSRSTAAMGSAVQWAVDDVREKLLEVAASDLEVDQADLEIRDGSVGVRGSPATQKKIGDVVKGSGFGTISGLGRFKTEGGLDASSGQGTASDHWHHGAVAAEVAVDRETGRVRVRKLRGSVYAGTVVNPVNASMQVKGSMTFGLSQALFEQLEHEEGHPVSVNLSEYSVATGVDLPNEFDVSLMEDPDTAEVHGLGETALPPVSPAIANAVSEAIGVRITDLPLTPERVLLALADAQDGEGDGDD